MIKENNINNDDQQHYRMGRGEQPKHGSWKWCYFSIHLYPRIQRKIGGQNSHLLETILEDDIPTHSSGSNLGQEKWQAHICK
jgi:hypothetical protein